MDRRMLLGSAAAAFTAAVTGHARADVWGIDTTTFKLTDAQKKKHAVRFPSLDVESIMDYAGGIKNWQNEYGGGQMRARREKFVASLGYDTGPTDLSHEACFNILLQDPIFRSEVRISRSVQELMWSRARKALYANEDLYMTAMEATDRSGPGSLELNPGMHIPEYTTYEIHEQPGGYVGDQFAGWLYHYALALAFYKGLFDGEVRHDEPHALIADRVPLPADRRVKRVLEIGCSDGRTTIALKERFPDAEVWGIDIGGPMVRYAHHRAVGMGLDIHFAQRLAEETQFPDDHFDIVVANLIFHEVTAAATRKIVPEMHRILRKGGVWELLEGNPATYRESIVSKAGSWVNHRYNNETWQMQWASVDMGALLTQAGFTYDPTGRLLRPVKT